ncbi:F-box/WD repeat-containing protein 7-like 1 [Homarus americanus]|uniref:F-box/WD repeat-containing protein 7-like 1 n=1 Tax=Homarus americanus TaxID=6706 RepID=A0A8J5JUP3_HOMAM|nr:F-box/WD repeat-containing protein 7-like 1 [Homarus americanus]
MMGDRVVDINVATVEDLEFLVGVGRAKAEAIVTTRNSMIDFRSVEDLLLVPGIGRSLIEQNRGLLVCSTQGGAPITRHSAPRRSLRRTSHDTRQRGESGKPEETSLEAQGDTTNCASSQAVKPTRIYLRDQSHSAAVDQLRAAEHSSATRSAQCKSDVRPKEEIRKECSEERREDESDKKKEVSLSIPEGDTSDCCECRIEDEEEEEEEEDEGEVTVDVVPVMENNDEGEEHADIVKEYIMSNDDLVNTAPEVKVSTGDVYHSGGGRNERSCNGGLVGGGLGTDTPHEDAPLDLPLDIQALASHQLTDEESSEEEEVDGGDEEEEEEEDEEEGHMEEGGVEYDSDDCMTVDPPTSPYADKKQSTTSFTSDHGETSRRKVCGLAAHKVSPPPAGLKSWLAKYQSWSPAQKRHALDSLIDVCDLNEVRHLHQIILPQFQRDFISLLPKELALYVLSFLPPKDLLRAAQTCKYWNILAADNLLWREKCREAGIDDHMIVMDRRRRKGTSVSHMSPFKAAFMRQHRIEMNWRATPLRQPRVLKGHDDHVITCLQFSGNTIVSGSDDNTLKVWNATSGKCMRTLTGHTGGVWSSQMSGNLIVSGSTDRMLRVWNAETGECRHTLYGHTSTVRCLHLHGNKVVSGSRDATLRVWDVDSGACEHVLVGHVAAVRCVQYNGRLVVSGAYDYMVKVWNADREECLHTLQGHTNRVYSLQFDGIHVVSGSLDTSIRVWDVETGQCRHTLMGHQSLTSGMELKNNILISGNADSTVKVWDIVTGQCLQTLSGSNKHRSAVTCLQFNNKFVVTSSDDGTVKLWDVRTGEFLRNLVALESGGSGGVVWRIRASDTKLVCAVGSRNGTEETKLLVLDFDVYENLK